MTNEELNAKAQSALVRAHRAVKLSGQIEVMVALARRVDHVTGVCDSSRRDISGQVDEDLMRAILVAGIDVIIKRNEREIRGLLTESGIDADVTEKGA